MTSVLESAAPAAVAAADPTRQPLKIGIVSPYGYPHPGGVNEHVRFTYEAMRRMGHDVWIITSKYGRERESEGHIIRLGTGWAAPANGSVGRVTLGLRFKRQVREVLDAQRFDVLHFHEPLVPFLSPTMLDASETVNIAHVPRLRRLQPVVLDRVEVRRAPGRQARRAHRGLRARHATSSAATSPASTGSSPTGSTSSASRPPSRTKSCATAR